MIQPFVLDSETLFTEKQHFNNWETWFTLFVRRQVDRKESIQVHLPKQNSTKSMPNAARSWLRLRESSNLLHLPRFFSMSKKNLRHFYTANFVGFCDFPTPCRLRSSAQMGAMYISMVARIVLIHRRWPTAILASFHRYSDYICYLYHSLSVLHRVKSVMKESVLSVL